MSSYGFANGFALKNYVESVFLAVQGVQYMQFVCVIFCLSVVCLSVC